MDTNEWVPVHTLQGFEACIEYFVNRKGDIKSTKGNTERLLKHQTHPDGYPMVSLTQRIGRQATKRVCVHKLVAFAFLPPPPTPYGRGKGCTMIDHIDEDKMNCHVDNLRWVSRSENNNKLPYKRFNGNANSDVPTRHLNRFHRKRSRDYMRHRRLDTDFKAKEAEAQRQRRANMTEEKKEAQLAINRERDAIRRKKDMEDPLKAERVREYKREWAKKNREKKKLSKLDNNAEVSDGRAHSAELGEGQSTDGVERKHLK